MTHDRRRILAFAATVPLALLGAAAGRAQAPACVPAQGLPFAQKTMRRSLGYVEPSADAKKRCGLCAFFKADRPGCGACQLLNGPVRADAVCNSFAPKPA